MVTAHALCRRGGPFILLEASRYLLVIFLKRRGENATRDSRQTLFFLVSSSGSYRIRYDVPRTVVATYYVVLPLFSFIVRVKLGLRLVSPIKTYIYCVDVGTMLLPP